MEMQKTKQNEFLATFAERNLPNHSALGKENTKK